jgi:hypothetical protein
MFAQGPLLRVRQGNEGTFVKWLEELGLKDFLNRYPIPKLIEWGWLVPQYRHSFPPEEFESEPEAAAWQEERRSDPLDRLWDSEWFIYSTDEPLWFLHPFFRPDDPGGLMLRNDGKLWSTTEVPMSFTTENGEKITPYVDYFFHWQGYALLDVIRFSDCIQPILNTPEASLTAQGIVRIVERVKGWDPRGVLSAPRRWGGLHQLMTWLSHYRAFRDALDIWETNHPDDVETRRRGTLELADYFGITADVLRISIKNNLLVLAEEWQHAPARKNVWIDPAWPMLQTDVYLAVRWLCILDGKKFVHYLDLWSYPPSRQSDGSAELAEVLPFEFYKDRVNFFRNAVSYLETYNAIAVEGKRLQGENLKRIVDSLLEKNYPFGSFLRSFSEMHTCLTYNFGDAGKIDFKEREPLDYYALVAIRAEGCLMYPLLESKEIDGGENPLKGLEDYILHHAQKRQLSAQAISIFNANKHGTKLHQRPNDAITRIINLQAGQLTAHEKYLVQAFFCCVLARNYFAHHFYDDKKLNKDKESGFLLGGILVTVLYLLGE